MKAIIFYILAISLSLIHNQDIFYGDRCESKDLIGEDDMPASDHTSAHHSVASCATLYPYSEDDDSITPRMCCYAKIKYKIEGEKFTRKGCYPVDADANIDEEIRELETIIEITLRTYFEEVGNTNVEIKDIDADIDCNSKFIKYSILLILIAFL